MKIPKLGMAVAVSLVLLVMSLMVMPVAASPDEYLWDFWGTAAVDGESVGSGTEISAWFYRGTPSEEKIGSTFTGLGTLDPDVYDLPILIDDVHVGDEVSFKIGTLWADQTVTLSSAQYFPEANLTATAPVVTTNDASDITTGSATLNGSLDDLGTAPTVDVSFEWGTTSGALDQETTPPETMTSTDPFSAPISGLASNTTYYFRAKATGSITVYGDELSFTTEEPLPDTTPPEVDSTSPEDGDTRVAVTKKVTAKFSEAMDSSTITVDSFTLAGSAVSGTVTYNSATYTATFTPDASLDYEHEYTATLSTAITDEADNSLVDAYTWSFTTGAKPAPPEEVEVEEEEIVSPKPELGPHVSVGNLRISPAEVSLNQPVTISLSVFNSGDRGGSKTLNLLINGELEQSTRVGIPAHGNKSFSFTVQRASPGVYSVYIEGASGWFTVSGLEAPSAPAEAGLGTGDVIAIVIIAIILIGGLTFAFLYARRSA